MVTTRGLEGSKEQIADQIRAMSGRILSVTVVLEEPASAEFREPTDEEFAAMMKELDAMAVEAPHVDYSREAMYTRMPGE